MNPIKRQAPTPGGRAAAWCWLILSLLWILITSCNPYVDAPTITPTARLRPTSMPNADPTAKMQQGTPTFSLTCTVRTGIPGGTVNLRTGAGVSHGVVRVLREGEILKITQRAAWLQVIDEEGNQGFIYARYCK